MDEHTHPLTMSLSADDNSSIGDLGLFPHEIRDQIYRNVSLPQIALSIEFRSDTRMTDLSPPVSCRMDGAGEAERFK